MSAKLTLKFLRVTLTIAHYALIIFSTMFLCLLLLKFFGKMNTKLKYEVIKFTNPPIPPAEKSAASGNIQYQQISNRYNVDIQPNSGIGMYSILFHVMYLLLGIFIVGEFRKVFRETKLDNPFNDRTAGRLKKFALLFIAIDLLKLLNYIIFSLYMDKLLPEEGFDLVTDVGGGIITGLIIWVIAVIFRRGNELQNEQSLTI